MTIGAGTLRNGRARAALLAALVLPLTANPASAQTDTEQQLDSRLALARQALARQALGRNDCIGVLAQVNPVLARPGFDALPDRTRSAFLVIAATCEARRNQLDEAIVHARAASVLPDASSGIWRFRFGLELYKGELDAAVTTLETMHKLGPDIWQEIDNDRVFALIREFNLGSRKNGPAHMRLMALIARADFAPATTDPNFDWPRLAYARQLARDGDRKAASALLTGMRLANALRNASLDPDLRGLMPDSFDLRAATERQLRMFEQSAKDRPALLRTVLNVARSLRALGRPGESLSVLEAARPYDALGKMFTDRDKEINWWWDELARTHARLGHYDDAVAAYRQAIAEGEQTGSGQNISQVINLAYLQHRFGHDKDALDTLSQVVIDTQGLASPYGQMEFHLAHGCAAWGEEQKDAADQDLAYAREHEKDHPEALGDLYACMGNLDGAAASIIRQLDDPERRVNTLIHLSEYDASPANVPPDPFMAPLASLRARDDVQAAIKRAGGIRRFHVLADSL